ncbi:aminotransferase class IV [Alicyclobacillus fastidiosus]|uniref:Aminotransferase class IV n=1 Tax=Alicyclobacillus fastidiosus TaxID=392011 RepID=A0ABY6ZD26_9BACL|nr:aminotransferase class IV [Alicyclobacillus fastidiosus]WAH40800.1 aminotransferase class IV [Alicyclobacillus fastidiosus]GMA62280.1 D-alanine aminotransferase [Alicyclobacillus fastidiosus]
MPVIGYYNGQYVNPSEAVIAIEERGHEFGDGIYEVIRVYGGRPFLLDWHIERLLNSLEAIRIASPYDAAGYERLMQEVLDKSGEREASIYVQITRGSAVRNHLFPEQDTVPNVSIVVRPVAPKGEQTPGKLLMQPDERWANVYIKTLNLLPNIVAKQTAHDAGADEALLVRDGLMIESASSNLWFVRNGELITAPTDRYILPGITRRYVLELARDLGIPVREEKLPREQLSSVDAIFITGTLAEIFAIDTVLSHPSIPISTSLPDVALHPVTVTPDTCKTEWTAKNFDVVHRLREEFSARIEELRKASVSA